MKGPFNKLLQRQIRKYLGGIEPEPRLDRFLDAVNETYEHSERDRDLLTRAMELSSGELMSMNRELQSKNEALDSFVYRVSHDLKTPANNVVSMVSMLREVLEQQQASPMVLKILDHLDHAGRTMQERISDLLDMTRVENGMAEEPELIDLEMETAAVQELLAVQIQESDARIETDFQEAPGIVMGKENFFSMLYNLVGNGIKYCRPDCAPVIQLSSGACASGMWLEIRDNGLGMDLDKDGGRLFNMFARLHNHVEGTGIGLYIVRKIVEYHNGNIHVKSKINAGTTFRIEFPPSVIPNEIEFNTSDRR